jgi:hypothetical protein
MKISPGVVSTARGAEIYRKGRFLTEEPDEFDTPGFFSCLDELSDDERRDRIEALTDQKLQELHNALRVPGVQRSVWLALIEAELRRRGLIYLS